MMVPWQPCIQKAFFPIDWFPEGIQPSNNDHRTSETPAMLDSQETNTELIMCPAPPPVALADEAVVHPDRLKKTGRNFPQNPGESKKHLLRVTEKRCFKMF